MEEITFSIRNIMEEEIQLEIPKPAPRDPNKTYYKTIEHVNSNRRQYERMAAALAGKNPNTISYQLVRDSPRPVDNKRLARAAKRASKLNK